MTGTDLDRAAVAEDVLAASGGDQAAFDRLIRRYAGLVWSVLRAHRLAEADAQDVFQTTWLRLVEHLDRIREPRAVGGWLATTARHEALRVLRHGERSRPAADEELDAIEDPGTGIEVDLVDADEAAALWAALEELDDRCRSLLRVLMADPPPTYEQVAAALDMPIGSIGPTRRRCLGRLREHLRTRGITA